MLSVENPLLTEESNIAINYQKIIERYDIERNEWVELKMQLTYGRVFSSAVTFCNRYIYVIGGTTNTDCFEIIDTTRERLFQKQNLFYFS
jgi:N-acetylneuraminic acid mutarotase